MRVKDCPPTRDRSTTKRYQICGRKPWSLSHAAVHTRAGAIAIDFAASDVEAVESVNGEHEAYHGDARFIDLYYGVNEVHYVGR